MSWGRDWRLPNPGEDDEMGRGRQRAKDAKIARQLKYANNGSDLRALERELVSGHPDPSPASDEGGPELTNGATDEGDEGVENAEER